MEERILNYNKLVELFNNLNNIEKDFDSVEILDDCYYAMVDLASMDIFERFSMVVDDTTSDYMSELVVDMQKLVDISTPIIQEFNGISKQQRLDLQKLLPKVLVGYGIVLYKSRGYDILAEALLDNPSVEISTLHLTPELMEDIAEDYSNVINTIHSILSSFRWFGSYFPEYQVNDEEDIIKLEDYMESRDMGVDAIVTLSREEVKAILGGE